MNDGAPTWIKTLGLFGGIIAVLVVVLSVSNRPTPESRREESFRETREALADLFARARTNFTESSEAVVLPPLPDSDSGNLWLSDSEDDPFLGPEDAEVVVVEFSDFQCPFCRASFPAIREIISRYSEVKYIYRDWPVDDVHPEARRAAEAAACAHEQELFWPYHDRLFQNQHDLTDESLVLYARQVGLDVDAFTECVNEGRFAAEVEEDRQIGIRLGVRGTPTWFINGEKIEGVIPREGWEQLFNSL